MENASNEITTRPGMLFFRSRRKSKDNSIRFRKAPPLLKLLRKGDFLNICQCLEDDSIVTKQWFEEEYGMMGENCLHASMKYKPSADVVVLMLRFMRGFAASPPELSVDLLGRTPLHHAVEFNCDAVIIEALLSTPPGKCAADVPDAEGRLPLHLAVLPVDPSQKAAKQGDIVLDSTVELLIKCSPQSVLICDYKGKSPIDHAKKHNKRLLGVILGSIDKAKNRDTHEGTTIVVPGSHKRMTVEINSSYVSPVSDLEDGVLFHC